MICEKCRIKRELEKLERCDDCGDIVDNGKTTLPYVPYPSQPWTYPKTQPFYEPNKIYCDNRPALGASTAANKLLMEIFGKDVFNDGCNECKEELI